MFMHSDARDVWGATRMTMERFASRILDAAATQTGQPIMGSTVDDARLGVNRLLSVAEQSVEILSGSLNPRIYGADEFVSRARQFLARSDATLRIILEKDDPADRQRHPLIAEFCEYPNFEIRILDKSFQEQVSYHFMVIDGSSYRFKSQKQNHKGMIAFGDNVGGAKLSEIFSIFWQDPATRGGLHAVLVKAGEARAMPVEPIAALEAAVVALRARVAALEAV